MKSKVRIQRKIETIKNIDDPLKALHELADLTGYIIAQVLMSIF